MYSKLISFTILQSNSVYVPTITFIESSMKINPGDLTQSKKDLRLLHLMRFPEKGPSVRDLGSLYTINQVKGSHSVVFWSHDLQLSFRSDIFNS